MIATHFYDASINDKRNSKWTKNCGQSFSQLKALLKSSSVLKYPDQTKTFIVDCDASNLAIGCVLSQETDFEKHPVAFAKKTLNKAERKYSTTRKELLSEVFALNHFRCYLDKTFLLRTDHASLRWLWKSKEIYGQCARWFEVLANFNFTLVHQLGEKRGNADALSRRPVCVDDSQRLSDNTNNFPWKTDVNYKSFRSVTECLMSIDLKTEWSWSDEFLAKEQRKGIDLDTVLNWMTMNSRPNLKNIGSSTSNLKHYWALFGELTMVDNCLFRKCEDDLNHSYLQLIVPPDLQQRVLEAMHDMLQSGGHMAADRWQIDLKTRFYWPKW